MPEGSGPSPSGGTGKERGGRSSEPWGRKTVAWARPNGLEDILLGKAEKLRPHRRFSVAGLSPYASRLKRGRSTWFDDHGSGTRGKPCHPLPRQPHHYAATSPRALRADGPGQRLLDGTGALLGRRHRAQHHSEFAWRRSAFLGHGLDGSGRAWIRVMARRLCAGFAPGPPPPTPPRGAGAA